MKSYIIGIILLQTMAIYSSSETWQFAKKIVVKTVLVPKPIVEYAKLSLGDFFPNTEHRQDTAQLQKPVRKFIVYDEQEKEIFAKEITGRHEQAIRKFGFNAFCLKSARKKIIFADKPIIFED